MGLQQISVATQEISNALLSLRSEGEALVVATQEDYVAACEVAKKGRAYIKNVGFKLDPGIESAKAHLEFLKSEKEKYIAPARQIVDAVTRKAEDWKAEERRKAAAEQERVNAERRAEAARIAEDERRKAEAQADADRKRREAEAEIARKEREKDLEAQHKAGEIGKRELEKQRKLAAEQAEHDRKAAEGAALEAKELAARQAEEMKANVQEVKVAATVPKVSGIRARVNWRFKIVDASRLPRAYLMPDEVAIGQEVRRLKNKEQAEAAIPGIGVWDEDSI